MCRTFYVILMIGFLLTQSPRRSLAVATTNLHSSTCDLLRSAPAGWLLVFSLFTRDLQLSGIISGQSARNDRIASHSNPIQAELLFDCDLATIMQSTAKAFRSWKIIQLSHSA